jgi:hypothetical protein
MKTREMDSRSFWVIQSARRNTVDKVCPLSMYCSQGSWCSTNLKWVWAGVWVWEIVLEWGSWLEPFYRPKAQVTREEYIEAIERWLQQTTSCDHAPIVACGVGWPCIMTSTTTIWPSCPDHAFRTRLVVLLPITCRPVTSCWRSASCHSRGHSVLVLSSVHGIGTWQETLLSWGVEHLSGCPGYKDLGCKSVVLVPLSTCTSVRGGPRHTSRAYLLLRG